MKAMPALPANMDPVAAQVLNGMVGEELRVGLAEYNRAVANRKPKAMPPTANPCAQKDVVLELSPDKPVAAKTAEPCDRESAEPKKKGPEQQSTEKKDPAPSPRAPPPTKPEAPTASSSSRPARRPFPPPRGFRRGIL